MGVIQFLFFTFFVLLYFGITGLILARLFGRGPGELAKEES
ncbi:MAG TPA: hypothetical protein VNH22_02770 [Blastocatellia bacterium]|jgi:hypothetical protein|nr:hypothetical protein [Blastocatellia bacterium]